MSRTESLLNSICSISLSFAGGSSMSLLRWQLKFFPICSWIMHKTPLYGGIIFLLALCWTSWPRNGCPVSHSCLCSCRIPIICQCSSTLWWLSKHLKYNNVRLAGVLNQIISPFFLCGAFHLSLTNMMSLWNDSSTATVDFYKYKNFQLSGTLTVKVIKEHGFLSRPIILHQHSVIVQLEIQAS